MDLKALQEYALKHRCNKLGEYAEEYKKIVPSIEEIKKVIDNLKLNKFTSIMTKEEIIKELNVCDFQDQSVLAALDTMAKGALWMQEKMIDKACEWLKEVYLGDYAWDDCRNAPSHLDNKSLMEDFKKAMEE